MKKWINTTSAYLSAIALGCLLTLAFAPYSIFPLGILAPAGLLALLLTANPRQGFWLGFWFGIGNFGTGVYWIYHSIHDIGGVPTPLALFITSGFIAVLSLFPAIVTFLTTRYFPYNTKFKLVLTFPAIWVLAEWFRTLLFTGFPWLLVGYTQIDSPLRGYAAILSVYGVSLITLMSSGLLVLGAIQYREKQYRHLYLSLFVMLTLWISGSLLNLKQWTEPQGEPKSIALVQGDIAQTLKWSPEHLQLSFDRYQDLTEPLYGKADIIIWPEAAIPVALDDARDFINDINRKAIESGSELILGIPMRNPEGSGYYNAVITLGSNVQKYYKRHLVPFGEYTPTFPFLQQALNFMDIPMSDSINGPLDQPPLLVDNIKILVSVCYEIAYPEMMRSTVINDSDLGFLLTVTNDGWFGKSNAQAQHLEIARMRALEFGRPLVFSSNDGITAIIGADGNISALAPPYEPYVLQGSVQPMQGLTPWMIYGGEPFRYFIIVFVLLSLNEVVMKRRANQKRTILETNI